MTYLTADAAAKWLEFPSTRAFYEYCRRRRGSLPVTHRGRVLLIEPVAFAAAMDALERAATR